MFGGGGANANQVLLILIYIESDRERDYSWQICQSIIWNNAFSSDMGHPASWWLGIHMLLWFFKFLSSNYIAFLIQYISFYSNYIII